MKNRLKVGVLLDDNYIPAWSYTMLEKIIESSCSEIVLIIKNNSQNDEKKNLVKRIAKRINYIFYFMYSKVDQKIFKTSPDAFDMKDIRDILTIDTIHVNPRKTKYRDLIIESDLDRIRTYNIDILIRLGFRILSGGILNAAKYGIWSFHHGDNKVNRGGPPGFWEVFQKWHETGVILQILTEDLDNGIVLKKSFSLTDNVSPSRNRNSYYWKAVSFIPSAINKLYQYGDEVFFKMVDELNTHPQFYYNRLYSTPTNKEMFLFIAEMFFTTVKNKLRSIFYFNQWILLFKISKSESISTSLFQFKKIYPPKDRFWADPHILKRKDKYYIFIEELLYSTNKGHISLIVMDEKGEFSEPIKVLERDYHLSYPFLIEDDGELYMIPESKENNTIELYKCIQFPGKWEFETVLIDNINAVDSTILIKDGRYWLFTNVVNNIGASSLDEVYIFSSEKLISNNWDPHPQNPVISDVKQSRPAGSFFYYKENLYRPSQNCSNRYGYGMKLNQVLELSQTEYKEKSVDSILPNWEDKLLGTHTLNHVSNLTVIDALIKRRRY